jgi:hypothetical protein
MWLHLPLGNLTPTAPGGYTARRIAESSTQRSCICIVVDGECVDDCDYRGVVLLWVHYDGVDYCDYDYIIQKQGQMDNHRP